MAFEPRHPFIASAPVRDPRWSGRKRVAFVVAFNVVAWGGVALVIGVIR